MRVSSQVRALIKGLLFTSPFVVGFLLLTLYPLAASLYYSFTEYAILTPPTWVGLANYGKLFTGDDLFWLSLGNTVQFTLMSVPAGLLMSFVLALALNARVRGVGAYRTIYFLPTLVPTVALAVVWLWMFNARYGVLNSILRVFGLPGLAWIADVRLAKPSLVLMGLWCTGQTVVIFLAGLQDVPQQLYEAADIDGANALQKVLHVTIPMLTPVILFNLIMGIIGGLQYFTQALVMTNGGPVNATLFYPLHLYRQAFMYMRMGYASALAWILFIITMTWIVAAFRSSRRWVYYGGMR